MYKICVVIMVICLALQGVYFFLRDAATPHLSSAFFLSDCAWALALLSVVFYRRYPVATLIAGWLAFGVFAIGLEKSAEEHSLTWFFVRNSLIITFLMAAHFGVFVKARQERKVKV